MKTEYRIWAKATPHATYRPGDLFPTLDAAKAATGFGEDVAWGTNSGLLFVGEEQVPESLEDRIRLAVDLIVRNGWIDGAHHKAWVMDQVVRVLTGDRYEQVVAEATADGSDWDEGIAP